MEYEPDYTIMKFIVKEEGFEDSEEIEAQSDNLKLFFSCQTCGFNSISLIMQPMTNL